MTNIIIRNLISNAVKYTKEGCITISASRDNLVCLINVKDTGIGIKQATIKRIFDIGDSVSTAGTSGERGTGRGLILCKEFADKNNGSLSVESEVGKGSEFTLKLPLSGNFK